jgi:Uncharacterized protein conserved in bacteria (DUF2312)
LRIAAPRAEIRRSFRYSPFGRKIKQDKSNKGKWWITADIAETGVAAQELRQFVERVERLEEEKKAITDDIRAMCGPCARPSR